MKKIAVLLFIILIVPLYASAELSTNLNLVTVNNWQTRSLIDRQTYVDADGNVAVPDDKGYATVKYTYNRRKKIKEEYLDENDKLVNCTDGYAYIIYSYKDNYLVGYEYFDVQGNPVNGPNGYARQQTTYSQGYHTSTWNYDTEGDPVGSHWVSEYIQYKKKRKLLTSETWYDTNNQLTPGPDGYARVEYEYEGKAKTKVTYIAADGSLFYYAKAGYAKMESEYRGKKKLSTHYYGKNNELTAGPEGYAYVLYTYQKEYDTEMYYNADGTPFYNDQGVCGIGTIRKGQYQRTEFYFVGEDERGACADGYYKTQIYTNSRGRITIQSYYDHNDQLMIVDGLGYASVQNEYKFGEIAQRKYLGTDGKLINFIEGYAVIRNTIEDKKIVKTEYFDADEKPFYVEDLYNEERFVWEDGHKTSESYWKDGSKSSGSMGYHETKIEYNGAGKESRSTFYDTDGNIMLCNEGYAIRETEYNSTGGVMCKRYYGINGELVLTPDKEYAFVKTIPFRDLKAVSLTEENTEPEESEEEEEEDPAETEMEKNEDAEDTDSVIVEYHGLDGKLMNITAGYARIIREKNEEGLVISEQYFDADGEPAVLAAGYSGVQREYDDAGNIIIERYYDDHGEKILCKEGYDEIHREYDENKKPIRQEYYADEQLTKTLQGYAIMLRVYDTDGCIVTENYYDEEEKPVNSISGYHKIVRTWADKDHPSSEAWFDTEDLPVTPNNTYVRREREYDENWNVTAERYYGADGEKTACKDGYDECRREYNEKGQAIRYDYYLNGEPVKRADGCAVMKQEYDDDGYVSVESYYDEQGKPTRITSGYHKIVRTWAGKDHPSSEAWFDTEDQPVTVNNTYVKREREYDDAWNVITERYYDANGEKILCKEGYDEIRREYDENKKPIRQEFYVNGQLTKIAQGYAILLREYDGNGFVATESYYNEKGEPVYSNSGYHKIVRTWADKDHPSSEAWFDTEDQPATVNNTYVKREREYDENWKVTAERYYGADGEKTACKDGYDELRVEYNEKGQAIRYSYYLNGEPAKRADGCAVMKQEYDDNGYVSVESYYDEQGKPTRITLGYHKIVRTWADKDHPSSEAWFDTEDQPVTPNNTYVRREREYDGSWNVIGEQYYGASGEKTPCKDGYDEIQIVYNDKKQATRYEYYLNGKLTNQFNGYAVMLREYGEDGFVSVEKYYNERIEPTLSKSGYHKIIRTWADKDHPSSEAWFDTEGRPLALNNNTYVKREREYDDAWNVITERYYDADGDKVLCKEGYDEIRKSYDEDTKTMRQEYYTDGQLTKTPQGYAIVLREYDEGGFVATESYFDEKERPVYSNSGYHKIIRTWADKDHPSSEAWFDTEDKPLALNNNIYVKREREYDDAWNVITERYYDANGERILCKEGYDETRREYDENKKPIRQEFYADGQLTKIAQGYAIMLREYDKDGFVAAESYYDEKERPVCSNSGYHKIVRTWADKDHPSSEAWFDTEDKPLALNNNTYVKREREYDDAWNVITERYYDANGERILCKEGYDEIRREYDDNKKPIRQEFYADGQLTKTPQGYAIVLREYDEGGFVATESYFDEKEEPVYSNSGYHKIVRTWADKDHPSSEAWFDTEGQPLAMNNNTYFKREREYDEAWNVIKERYYDANDNKVLCKEGYDEIHRVYDENKKPIRQEYYADGQLTKTPQGYTIMLREYDEDGFVRTESYYDEKEEPVYSNSGYHKIVRTWADRDHPSSEAWFDTEGQPLAMNNNTYFKREREYDDAWNVIKERYYDANGDKVLCKEGYDEIRKSYDEKTKTMRQEYYVDGQLTKTPQGYAIMLREYDEGGFVATESYFDEKEEPVYSNSGYHKIVRTWADRDHPSSEAWFDTEGQPLALNNDTYVKREREYDDAWNVITERYYDNYGKQIPCKDGYDEIRWVDGKAAYYLNGEKYTIPEEKPEEVPEDDAA